MRNKIIIPVLSLFVLLFIIDSMISITKHKKVVYIYTGIYFVLLYMVLFDRETIDERLFSDGGYILKWIKLVFTNRTVFLNIFGNIALFVPMGILLKQFSFKPFMISMLSLGLIITIELLQYMTQKGIFDILDIVLNILGIAIGYMIVKKTRWVDVQSIRCVDKFKTSN
ncbi:MAG: VanZ family protein [Prevotella sp.]|nr:VanZ family protein [Staphylococcus sp.]MCM1350138.1 VanZ family protein [Prevotella sp.]